MIAKKNFATHPMTSAKSDIVWPKEDKKKKEQTTGGVQWKILFRKMLENDGCEHGSFSRQHPFHECYLTSHFEEHQSLQKSDDSIVTIAHQKYY